MAKGKDVNHFLGRQFHRCSRHLVKGSATANDKGYTCSICNKNVEKKRIVPLLPPTVGMINGLKVRTAPVIDLKGPSRIVLEKEPRSAALLGPAPDKDVQGDDEMRTHLGRTFKKDRP